MTKVLLSSRGNQRSSFWGIYLSCRNHDVKVYSSSVRTIKKKNLFNFFLCCRDNRKMHLTMKRINFHPPSAQIPLGEQNANHWSIVLSQKRGYGGKPPIDNRAQTDNYKPTVSLIISLSLDNLLPIRLPGEKESSCMSW